MKAKKRILAYIMAVILCLNIMPTIIYAGTEKNENESAADIVKVHVIAEVSLKGLSYEQCCNARISANKVVSSGTAMDGSERDALFNHFPKDENGDYVRYQMELHSETIDENGDWLGEKIPKSTESDKVDIVL